MTINRESKFTGARQGLEIRAIFNASNDFFASTGSVPALKPESLRTNLFRGAEREE